MNTPCFKGVIHTILLSSAANFDADPGILRCSLTKYDNPLKYHILHQKGESDVIWVKKVSIILLLVMQGTKHKRIPVGMIKGWIYLT